MTLQIPSRSGFCSVVVLLSALLAAPALAQRADVPIEPRKVPPSDPAVLEKLKPLRESGRLLSIEQIREGLSQPRPRAVGNLPAPNTAPRSPAELAVLGRKALLRIGWVYLCNSCNNWHLETANGYALSEDGLACTCYHVLKADTAKMREGYAFAMNVEGDVFPITRVLAADSTMDAAIVQLEGSGFVPLPLNGETSPGESVYLCSDPSSYAAYFSTGIINRFYWENPNGEHDRDTLAGIKHLRIDVSSDWSPGSSGAALLDQCGNAIGHVAVIHAEMDPRNQGPIRPGPTTVATTQPSTRPTTASARATYIIFHQAIPARSVRMMVEAMK